MHFTLCLVLISFLTLNPFVKALYMYEYEIESTTAQPIKYLPHSDRTRYQVPLDPKLRGDYMFSITSNASIFGLNVAPTYLDEGWKLDIIVMQVRTTGMMDNQTRLIIEGKESNGQMRKEILLRGMELEEDSRRVIWVKEDTVIKARYGIEGLEEADIWIESETGEGFQVKLVATIYQEVSNNCGYCNMQSLFCCGASGPANRFRCIPGSGLICNERPNCGLYSSRDEDICPAPSKDEPCFTPDCNLSSMALTFAALVLWCFLLPPILIMIACRFPPIRMFCEKFSNRTASSSCCFPNIEEEPSESRDAEESPPAYSSYPRGPGASCDSGRPSAPRQSEEQPPSYEELLRSNSISVVAMKEEVPPPPFQDVVRDGVVNPAYVDREGR